jgi:hypothetical protein
MQSALELAGRLTDETVRSGTLGKVQVGEKRKFDNRNFRGNNNNSFKKPAPVARNYVAVVPHAAVFAGQQQKCPKCTLTHQGECPSCFKCKKLGHIAKFCQEKVARACFECGDPNHLRNVCPKRNVNQGAAGNRARGRVFAIGANEARQDPNVVTGTFLLNNCYASMLFDTGADNESVEVNGPCPDATSMQGILL